MSMSGGPGAPRGPVGEVVADVATYEAAQQTVSRLIAGDVPAREISIVGHGLRSVERVTGRLGYATAARQGAVNGILLGLLFSAVFVLGNPSVPIQAFVGVMFVGVAVGMLLSLVLYAIFRRRRDYASITQFVAERYQVLVLPSSIHRARQVVDGTLPPKPPRGTSRTSPPQPAGPPEQPPAERPRPTEPPRYGERIDPPES